MNCEHPNFIPYQAVVAQAEIHARLACENQALDGDMTTQLVIAALNAFSAGLPPKEISAAIVDGTRLGISFYKLQAADGHDLLYEQARAEAETLGDCYTEPKLKEDNAANRSGLDNRRLL